VIKQDAQAIGATPPDADATPDPDRYHVPALARGLELLARFTRRTPQLTGAELARDMGLPRASVFRMLHTLERAGFVERVGDSATYRLGLGVLRLGFEYLASMELTEIGHPVIMRLRDRTGCSAHLVVRDDREVVFVAKAAGASALFQSVQVGARLPAHATVLGRLLLADLDANALRNLYPEARLQRFTEQTPDTIDHLRSLIEADRARGWAMSEGGFETGISTIAAPVSQGGGRIAAVVSVTVPAQRVEPARARMLAEQVREAAAEISVRLAQFSSETP
jgi:DNA-binding IclR family transcriptional regulator